MGSDQFWYFVKYKPNIKTALRELREREFMAGRYFPAIDDPISLLPITDKSPAFKPKHRSMKAAREDADGCTRSIVDLDHISDEPEDYAITPLDEDTILEIYGAQQPTHAMVEQDMSFFGLIGGCQGVYLIVYKDGKPDEILFAGIAFD